MRAWSVPFPPYLCSFEGSALLSLLISILAWIIIYRINEQSKLPQYIYDALAAIVSDWKETVNDVHTMTSKANLSRRFSNVIIGLHSMGAFICVYLRHRRSRIQYQWPWGRCDWDVRLWIHAEDAAPVRMQRVAVVWARYVPGVSPSIGFRRDRNTEFSDHHVSEWNLRKKFFSSRLLHPLYGKITVFLFRMTTVFVTNMLHVHLHTGKDEIHRMSIIVRYR